MTPAEIIADARILINDTRTPQRFSDADLLVFVNQTLKRMAMLRPDLFLTIGDLATTADTTVQTMPSDSIRLVDIFAVKDGNTVTEADREVFDQTYPSWRSDTSGTPTDFMRHPRNPNTYFLYPAPTSGIVLIAEYSQVPTDYTLSDPIAAPVDAFKPTLVDGVVYLAESIDDEHVNSGRAKLFLDSFNQALGLQLESRVVTDDDYAAMDEKKVS